MRRFAKRTSRNAVILRFNEIQSPFFEGGAGGFANSTPNFRGWGMVSRWRWCSDRGNLNFGRSCPWPGV